MRLDMSVLRQRQTWAAAVIAGLMFVGISVLALSAFDIAGDRIGEGGEIEPIPVILFDSLQRDGIESEIMDEEGRINTSLLRGGVLIIDLMAHDCTNCHAVQHHLEDEIPRWEEMESARELHVIAYGAWYDESLEYLNTSEGGYKVPGFPTGLGSVHAAILENGTLSDPVRLLTAGGTGLIPAVLVIDHEGYIIARENTGTPTDGWSAFDSAVETALTGNQFEIESLRTIGIAEEKSSASAIFALGVFLSILVFFSPCAFPVLPSFVTFQMTLMASEASMDSRESRGIKPPILGLMSGFGMVSFFLVIGIIAAIMGRAFALSGMIRIIAIFVAFSLAALGLLNLMGWTSNLFSFVQRAIDRPSEESKKRSAEANTFLYGVGYAAASIDCTAIAVLPFVVFLGTMGVEAVFTGLLGLALGLILLMVIIVSLVGYGNAAFASRINPLTQWIKVIGSWMMIFAGTVLLVFLFSPETISSVIQM